MRLIILFLLPLVFSSKLGGLRVSLSYQLVSTMFLELEDYLQSQLSSFPIEGFNLSLNSTEIGFSNVTADFTFDLYNSEVSFYDPDTIGVNLFETSIKLSFDYSLNSPRLVKSGKGTASLIPEGIFIMFAITNSANGAPQVQVSDFELGLNSITFDSDLPSSINQEIQNFINEELPTLQSLIEQEGIYQLEIMNYDLTERSYVYYIQSQGVYVDLSLLEPVNTNGNYLIANFKGEVMDSEKQPVIPYTTANFTSPWGGNFVAQLSDYFVSSLLTVRWRNYTNTIKTLPNYFQMPMTTTGLKNLVPQLAKTYGKNKPVTLQISSSPVWPTAEISTQGIISLQIGVLCGVYVTGAQQPHALDINALFNVKLSLNSTNSDLFYMVQSIDPVNIVFSNSSVGTINVKSFTKALKAFIKQNLSMFNKSHLSIKVPIIKLVNFAVSSQVFTPQNGYSSLSLMASFT